MGTVPRILISTHSSSPHSVLFIFRFVTQLVLSAWQQVGNCQQEPVAPLWPRQWLLLPESISSYYFSRQSGGQWASPDLWLTTHGPMLQRCIAGSCSYCGLMLYGRWHTQKAALQSPSLRDLHALQFLPLWCSLSFSGVGADTCLGSSHFQSASLFYILLGLLDLSTLPQMTESHSFQMLTHIPECAYHMKNVSISWHVRRVVQNPQFGD